MAKVLGEILFDSHQPLATSTRHCPATSCGHKKTLTRAKGVGKPEAATSLKDKAFESSEDATASDSSCGMQSGFLKSETDPCCEIGSKNGNESQSPVSCSSNPPAEAASQISPDSDQDVNGGSEPSGNLKGISDVAVPPSVPAPSARLCPTTHSPADASRGFSGAVTAAASIPTGPAPDRHVRSTRRQSPPWMRRPDRPDNTGTMSEMLSAANNTILVRGNAPSLVH